MKRRLKALRPGIVIERHIARVPETAWGVREKGWAPGKVRAIVHIMLPFRMRTVTNWTIMSLTPTEMSNLRGIDGTTQ